MDQATNGTRFSGDRERLVNPNVSRVVTLPWELFGIFFFGLF